MVTQADKARAFLSLHRPGEPLLLPNPWDLGSARLLASLGFKALATTSSGFAATLGRNDGSVSREEALIHAAVIVAATDLPVSADLENAFADAPDRVAETLRLAIQVGLAGASVEDFSGREEDPIYALRFAADVSRQRRRPLGKALFPWCSPPARKTTCTVTPILPTRSPGCRPTRRTAPIPVRPGPAPYRRHPPSDPRSRPPGQRAGPRGRPHRGRTGRGGRQPDLGGRLVRIRRPGGTRQRRDRTAGPGNLRLPGGRAAGRTAARRAFG